MLKLRHGDLTKSDHDRTIMSSSPLKKRFIFVANDFILSVLFIHLYSFSVTMRRQLSSLFAALLLPASLPLLLSTATSTTSLLIMYGPALAKGGEALGELAQAIMVRIEGATQGSGVLVKRDGNRYTVLTAWHVVRGQRPGEELDVFAPDGQRHSVVQGSIKQLGNVDMAILSFTSQTAYEVARIGDVNSVATGDYLLVAGFPVSGKGRLKYDNGNLVANANVGIDHGYQLLYSNDTESGMSGGAVLRLDGTLIGVHGRGELDELKTVQSGLAVKTGTNQGVPISYYRLFLKGAPVVAASNVAASPDDYLVQARLLLRKKGGELDVIKLTTKVLAMRQIPEAYFYRAYAKSDLGQYRQAIDDFDMAVALRPMSALYRYNRGNSKLDIGDYAGALSDYSKVVTIDPGFSSAYLNMGVARHRTGDAVNALKDYSKAIAASPLDPIAYHNRAKAYSDIGDKSSALFDLDKAIFLAPSDFILYYDRARIKADISDFKGAEDDFGKSINANPKDADSWGMRAIVRLVLGNRIGACTDLRKSFALGSPASGKILKKEC